MDTQTLQNQINDLKNRVDFLEKENKDLKNYSTIPLENIRAMEGNWIVHTYKPEFPLGAEMAGAGFVEEIGLTGNPQTITVHAIPTSYIKVRNAENMYIPIYKYN